MSDNNPPTIHANLVSERLKLLINTRSNTVVHAEASKRFVDLLFMMFTIPMPLGSFIGMTVTGQVVNSSLGNLLASIQNLVNSHHILNNEINFFEPLHEPLINRYNTCTRGHNVEAGGPFCPDCYNNILTKMRYVSAPKVKEGLYMVTDDLVVKPIPTTGIAMPGLEERVVNVVIGQDEAVMLNNALFVSKKVFTDVFILRRFHICGTSEFLPSPM